MGQEQFSGCYVQGKSEEISPLFRVLFASHCFSRFISSITTYLCVWASFIFHVACACVEEEEGVWGVTGQTDSLGLEGMRFLRRRWASTGAFRCPSVEPKSKTDFLRLLLKLFRYIKIDGTKQN